MIDERRLKHPRHRRFDPNKDEEGDPEEYEYAELELFGVKIKKTDPPSSCPYNEQGEYVPRNQRQ